MVISLESLCSDACVPLVLREHGILNVPKYQNRQAVMELPTSIAAWEAEHRTARKRCYRAERALLEVATIEPRDHFHEYVEINRSAPERQGRPMSDAYVNLKASTSLVGPPRCPRHHTRCYGVFSGDRLVAYSTFYRVGELVHLSQFLGHADFLERGTMYLLIREVMRDQILNGEGVLYYNLWDSGTEGLRFFKQRVGFRPEDVEWTL
jgi:hypothetical protein